ncbi:UNVERIFIED_CONTAM: hypothetical protein K2H54_057124 [Gekko kuhli]
MGKERQKAAHSEKTKNIKSYILGGRDPSTAQAEPRRTHGDRREVIQKKNRVIVTNASRIQQDGPGRALKAERSTIYRSNAGRTHNIEDGKPYKLH